MSNGHFNWYELCTEPDSGSHGEDDFSMQCLNSPGFMFEVADC